MVTLDKILTAQARLTAKLHEVRKNSHSKHTNRGGWNTLTITEIAARDGDLHAEAACLEQDNEPEC